jgi:formylglycine-generating enzyme required for sulfatase activity
MADPSLNPQGPADGSHKVLRGGCFDWNPANLVPTYRNYNLPNNRGFQNGVRVARGWPPFLEAYLGHLPEEQRGDFQT